jgi:glycosyltransferase involved in cell wall biosynthesis
MAIWADPDRYPPTVNAANYLAEGGREVLIIGLAAGTHGHQTARYSTGVKIHRVAGGDRSRWRRLLALIRFFAVCAIESWYLKPSIIIGYDNFGLIGGSLARVLARRAQFVYHSHDVSQPTSLFSFGGLAWLCEKHLVRVTRFIVLPDAHRARSYAALMRLTNPIVVVPNAPRLHKAHISHRGLLAADPQLVGRRIVVRHGNIGPGHAIEAILDSIRSWSPDAAFVVIGPGVGSYSKELLALAQRLGVAGRFSILPPVDYPEILDVVGQADIGIALYDGPQQFSPWAFAGTASNKAMEYLAAGIPFLVDRHPASAIFVDAGVAIAVDPRNPNQITTAISELMSDPSRRASMGSRALALHRNQMNFEHGFAELESVLGIAKRRAD